MFPGKGTFSLTLRRLIGYATILQLFPGKIWLLRRSVCKFVLTTFASVADEPFVLTRGDLNADNIETLKQLLLYQTGDILRSDKRQDFFVQKPTSIFSEQFKCEFQLSMNFVKTSFHCSPFSMFTLVDIITPCFRISTVILKLGKRMRLDAVCLPTASSLSVLKKEAYA